MRLAFDNQATLGNKSGIGVYAASLLAALRRLAPELETLELNMGREVRMRLDQRLRWQQVDVPRRARAARVDLLHVPGFDAPLWKPCPVVLTVHDLVGMLFPRNFPPVARFYWSRWLPFSIRFADAILADSEATRRDLIRLLQVPADKIRVVPLGVEPRFQPPPPEQILEVRERLRLPEHFILYLGTLEPRKGLDTLIMAYAALAGKTSMDLVLAGKRGWHWQPLIEMIAHEGLEARTHLLDFVPDEVLTSLYAAATVFVFPSRYEGFGLPPLEAMACGTPVIASNVSSLPEIIGQAGILVAPNDARGLARAILDVTENAGLRAHLRAEGVRQARKFTWERTARETLDVYQTVCHAHHR